MKKIPKIKNFQNKICFSLLLFIYTGCQTQNLKLVDLEKISNEFDVHGFYQKKIIKTNEILSTDPKTLDKAEAKTLFLNSSFFEKDTLAFYKSDGRFPTKLCLNPTNDWMSRNQKPTEIFGYKYKTVMYSEEKDSLAILNTVVFPKMDMAVDKKGKLMYVDVSKTSKISTDYEKIKNYLEKNCKKVNIKDDHLNVSYWENVTFYFILTRKENKEEEILSYDLEGNKKSKMIDVTDINLVMFNKSYINKMEELNIFSYGTIFWKKEL